MQATVNAQVAVCLALTRAISRTRTVDEIYTAALDALRDGLGVSRAAILLFDVDGVMRFKAHRNLSETYRHAVEGHTPWSPDTPDPEPLVIADVRSEPSLTPFLPTVLVEGIAAMTFIPLVSVGRVIGKFMLYFETPTALAADDLELAGVVASQVAFAVERTNAEERAHRGEERLRFALDAASMGTWDWDLASHEVRWSDNFERIHGFAPGTLDATFGSYEREIHPGDRQAVQVSIGRAIRDGVSHDVEYRVIAQDGGLRWVEAKGHVQHDHGRPSRMTGVCMMITRGKEARLARLAAAEEASRVKDEFLTILSHELRTPLNAICGWVQMLQAGGLPPERARDAIGVIGRNARLQAQLIDDILDVSRIITGKLDIERQPVFVPALIDAVVSSMLPAIEARHLQLEKTVPEGLPPIEGDAKRLHQVLGNLLSNAIKFTPEQGRVEIQCRADGDWVQIEVVDSGVGIAPEFLPFMFDRLRQADSRSTRRHGGLGLGLAIARHLVQEHGGTLRAHSDGPARGTTMTIRLPAGAWASARPQSPPLRAPAGTLELRMEGATVVVVDDQPDSCELLGMLLGQCGARVLTCDSVAAALRALASVNVHLLVADIAMPEADGYELIRRVRQSHRRLPAVAVSAYARPEDRARALACGFNGYCPKPLDTTLFLQTVRNLMPVA